MDVDQSFLPVTKPVKASIFESFARQNIAESENDALGGNGGGCVGLGFREGRVLMGADILARVEKVEGDLRSLATLIRVLLRQLEKLGVRVRATRKALKEPIAEDLFFGGGDSTSILMQWVMAELLHDPKKMSKAQAELRSVLGADEKRQAVESDIPKLPYLSAMIKETLRFRPGAPLLSPHKAREDVEINGYTIPKGASILVNVWAITRDPKVWPNPNSFEPERFLGSDVDYRGHHFELIPFGSGRRMCPGMPLVHLTSHMLVAHMIHSFDWKVEELDVDENVGFFLLKSSTPVMAVPIMKNY